MLINGHGGNHELIQLVARDLAIKHNVKFAAMSYWTVAWDALVEEGAHLSGNLPGHAGFYETSQIMALRPDLVVNRCPIARETTAPTPAVSTVPFGRRNTGFWKTWTGIPTARTRAMGSLERPTWRR